MARIARYALIETARELKRIARFGRCFSPPSAYMASELATLFGVSLEDGQMA
jgi:hypothetical protein